MKHKEKPNFFRKKRIDSNSDPVQDVKRWFFIIYLSISTIFYNFAPTMCIKRLLWALCVALLCWGQAAATVHEPGSASQLKVKGDMMVQQGRYSEALEYYTQALELAKDGDETHIYTACLGNISNIYAVMGDPQRSLHYQKQGYEAAVAAGDTAMMELYTINIVGQYCMLDDVEKAKVFFKKQMQLSSGDPVHDRYYALYNQGMIAQTEGHIDQATYYYKAALNHAQEHQMDAKYVITQVQTLGRIALMQGQYDDAIQQFMQAEQLANQADNLEMVSKAYKGLARAYDLKGDSTRAAKYRSMSVTIGDSIYNRNRFSTASGKLFEYENAENQRQINRLVSRNHTQLLIILAFALLAAALTLFYLALRRKNRSLLEAQRMLVTKNQELMASEQLLQARIDKAQRGQDERNDIGLSQEAIDQLLSKVSAVMERLDVISSPDFSLSQLAQMVDSNTKYVSWVINDAYGKNFKAYLNEYRIREACRRLADDEHYGNMTIQAICETVGYQSASAFITAFKKSVGMTPSTYQRLAREQQETQD